MNRFLILVAASLILSACTGPSSTEDVSGPAAATETAEEFVDRINAEYKVWWRELNAADWTNATYINADTNLVNALANERYTAWHAAAVESAKQYDGQDLSADTRRALDVLKNSALMIAPDDDAKRKELAQILADMNGAYGAGKYCRSDDDWLSGNELELLMNR